MTPDRTEPDDATDLLAECDDALAAGRPPESVYSGSVAVERLPDLERGVAWCRLVRRLLSGPGSTASLTPGLPPPATPPPPDRLGRFVVRRELGRGGFGVVFLAYDPRLGRDVALKVPRPEVLASPRLHERFRQEGRAAAGLDHPNVVPVYEAGEDGPVCYIASSYCPGTTLSAWLRDQTDPVPPDAAARLVAALADGVAHAHGRGVVHRDLKPGNVMLAPRPAGDPAPDGLGFVPRITDFGLAKLLEAEPACGPDAPTHTAAILGTPGYMAPEQARGGRVPVGPPADVYALGAVLYEVLAGRPPFRGETPFDTLVQVVEHDPVPPSRLRPGIPRDLETVCLKCLEKDPHRRYATADAVADDLRRFLARQPVRARRAGAAARARLWVRRNPAVAATVGAAAAVVLLVVGVAFARVVHDRDRLRDEREHAVANLYRSLVGEARALRLGRANGYRVQAWDRLRQARELDTPAQDIAELRREAVACLGDFVGQEPVGWDKPERFEYFVTAAIDPDTGEVVCGTATHGRGKLTAYRLGDGAATATPWQAHPAGLYAAAAGPGGRLVTADEAGRVKVWRRAGPDRRDCVREFDLPATDRPNHLNAVTLSLTPDGRWLAACSRGSPSVSLWDLESMAAGKSFGASSGDQFLGAALTPDGRLLAAPARGGGQARVRVWEVDGGRELQPLVPGLGAIESVTFGDGGRYLACACAEGVAVFAAPDFRPRLVVRGESPYQVAFSPDGRWLAIPSPHLGTTRVWDVALNREVAALRHPDEAHTAVFHPDGSALVVISANHARVWDLRGGGEKTTLAGHQGGVNAVAFGPDGSALATAGGDRTVRVWEPGTGRQRLTLDGFGGPVLGVAVAPGGRHLLTADEAGGVRVWDVASRPARALAALESAAWGARSVAWSADGRHVAAAGPGGTRLWPLAGTDPPRFDPPTQLASDFCDRLAFSADNRRLAWVHDRRYAHVRELATGATFRRPNREDTLRLGGTGFLPDGRLLVMSEVNEAEVWDPASGARTDLLGEIRSPDRVNWYQGELAAVDPAGAWLAVLYRDILIWDIRTRRLLLQLPREPGAPTCLVWAPSGGRLAVGSADGGLVVWDLPRVNAELGRIGLGW